MELSRREDVAVDLSSFTILCRTLALMGHSADGRISRPPTTSPAPPFSAAPRRPRRSFSSPPFRRENARPSSTGVSFSSGAGSRCGDPAARRPGSGPAFLSAGFPNGEETDLVGAPLGAGPHPPEGAVDAAGGPLGRGLALLLARADHRGRWMLERPRRTGCRSRSNERGDVAVGDDPSAHGRPAFPRTLDRGARAAGIRPSMRSALPPSRGGLAPRRPRLRLPPRPSIDGYAAT